MSSTRLAEPSARSASTSMACSQLRGRWRRRATRRAGRMCISAWRRLRTAYRRRLSWLGRRGARLQTGAHRAGSDGALPGPCYARPEDAVEGSDGTVYSSLKRGRGAGRRRSARHRRRHRQALGRLRGDDDALKQRTDGPDRHRGPQSSVTLDGGWDSAFSTRNPSSTPTTLDAASSGRVVRSCRVRRSAFLNNLTLTHGSIAGSGGGLYLAGPTTLDGVTVSNNAGYQRPRRRDLPSSTLTIRRTPRYRGTRQAWGGGIMFDKPAVPLKNTTISGNTAAYRGGGFFLRYGTLQLASVTITDNQAAAMPRALKTISGRLSSRTASFPETGCASYGQDIYNFSTFTTLGGNLLGNGASADYDQTVSHDKLKLGALANNGGATQTHLPAADSPAIDVGSGRRQRRLVVCNGRPAGGPIPGRVWVLPCATPARWKCRT